MALTRREAREVVLGLVFETDFHPEDGPENIYNLSVDTREIGCDDYVRDAYFGITGNLEEIDRIIGVHSRGWKTYRMSGISRAAMRIAAWEMLHADSIPSSVSINEAIELVKKFDDPKARTFVNGVLNAIKDSLEEKKADDNAGDGEK